MPENSIKTTFEQLKPGDFFYCEESNMLFLKTDKVMDEQFFRCNAIILFNGEHCIFDDEEEVYTIASPCQTLLIDYNPYHKED